MNLHFSQTFVWEVDISYDSPVHSCSPFQQTKYIMLRELFNSINEAHTIDATTITTTNLYSQCITIHSPHLKEALWIAFYQFPRPRLRHLRPFVFTIFILKPTPTPHLLPSSLSFSPFQFFVYSSMFRSSQSNAIPQSSRFAVT